MVAAALVLLPQAANAQSLLTVSRSKSARTDTTRADSARADSMRARIARAVTVASPDTTRPDTARVQVPATANDTTANDTTGVGRGDTTVGGTTGTAVFTDTAALARVDSTRSGPSVTQGSRADSTMVIRADSTEADTVRTDSVATETDSTDSASADVTRTNSLVLPMPDAVRSAFAANPAAKSAPTFSEKHQNYDRVLSAKVEKRFELKKLFRDRGLTFPADEVFLRIFKRERTLEVWVRNSGQAGFSMLKSYRICALGTLVGPKRVQGDGQTPEGFYYIDGFNPTSDFHLSLKIDYPNRSDRLRSEGRPLGGDIFIHGGCKTLGCLAVTDDAIKELYWLAVEARNAGQRIAVHIFPTRLTGDALHQLVTVFHNQPDLQRFWASLKPGYDFFELNHRLPEITIDDRGWYRIKPFELAGGVPVRAAEPTHAKLKN